MADKNKIKELLEQLNTLSPLPTQEVGDFADQIVSAKMKGLSEEIRNDASIKAMSGISAKLDQFKTDFNLSPINDAINEINQVILNKETELKGLLEQKTAELSQAQQASNTASGQITTTLSQEINDLKDSLAALSTPKDSTDSLRAEITALADRMTGSQTSFQSELDKAKGLIPDMSIFTAALSKLEQNVETTRTDLLNRISNIHGGGQANRNIKFSGSVLSRYTDLNLLGASFVNNDTTKQADVTLPSSGGGSTNPGGLNAQVQYNNNGSFGGVSGATTNGSILSLTNALLGGAVLTTSSVNGVFLQATGSATSFLNASGAYSAPTGGAAIGSVLSGGSDRAVLFVHPSSVLSQDVNNFSFQDNATTPQQLGTNTNVAFSINTGGDNTGSDAVNIYAQYDAYLPNATITNTVTGFNTDGAFPAFTTSSSRGTGTVPVILNTGDTVGGFSGWGYTGSSPAYQNLGGMMVFATGATAANLGGELRWYTKTDGGLLTQVMALSNAGHMTIEGVTSTGATGTGNFVFATSPTLTTPILGVATATSINGNTFTTGTYTLTGTAAKTLNFTNTLTLSGTDGTTMTFPTTSATLARTDTAQTYTGTQTFANTILTANAITASSNAATIPVTSGRNIVTNNSAAGLTITLATSGAVSMQTCVVQILPSSAVAQTLTFVNTENSVITSVPANTGSSTTIPITVGFFYNAGTSKWTCVASS